MRNHPLSIALVVGLLGGACSSGNVLPGPDDDPDPDDPDGGGGGEPLEPGLFVSPLLMQQRLQGTIDHLHVDEVRLRADGLLLQCAYTFAVVDARNPQKMRYLSQGLRHTVPNDTRTPGCIHLASEGELVFTTHRGNISNPAFLSGWDITNRAAPVQLPVLQEPGISYEGVDAAGGLVYVGLKEDGLGIYQRDVDNEFVRVGTANGFTSAWGVFVRASDSKVFVADGQGGLVTVDVTDPAAPVVLGRVVTGGDARNVKVDGNIAYVAAGSAGVVVVDVSNLASPTIISRIAVPGSALRVAPSQAWTGSRVAKFLSVAAWNDARVYDVTDPTAPRFLGAARLTQDDGDITDNNRPAPTQRILGIAARGTDIFVGSWWVLHSFKLYPGRVAPNIRLGESASLTDFGPVAVGDTATLPLEIANQGTAPLTLVDNSVVGDAYRVQPRQLRLQPGETASLEVTFTPSRIDKQVGYLNILSDDPAQPLRIAYLVGNQPGLGVGMPLPETNAVLLDGNPWYSSQTEGKVVLLAYFATF